MNTQIQSAAGRQVALVAALATAMLAVALLPEPASGQVTRRPVESWGNLPLSFEENRGQVDSRFQFLTRAHGLTFMTQPSGAVWHMKGSSLQMTLQGASRSAAAKGVSPLPGQVNYLVGQNKSEYKTGIPTFSKIRYSEVYPGIDVVYYGNQRDLEYDFVVRPGARPQDIRISFKGGASRLDVDAEGNLLIQTPVGELKQRRPVVYQEHAGQRREIRGSYQIVSDNQVAFSLDRYDTDVPLVIDPVVAYSSYIGAIGDDRGNGIAVDGQGSAYVVGQTYLNGSVQYAFVSKFNPSGTAFLYTTVIGNGQCNTTGNGIAVDAQGNAIITGMYGYVDQWGYCNNKGVLTSKLNPAGNAFVYNQYFGGGDYDHGNAVVVDAQGNAYFTGVMFGDGPVTAGAFQVEGGGWQDAFAMKLDPNGNVVFATYLGGGWMDEGFGIAIDAAKRVYVAGTTGSANFPVTANGFQTTPANGSSTGFVSQLSADGRALLYSTFLGGGYSEDLAGVAVDATGVYVTGTTNSSNFPTTSNAYDRACGTDGACNPTYSDFQWHYPEDAFLTKLDTTKAGAASLVYSTYLGGFARELSRTIALDGAGHVWIAGRTGSFTSFPVLNPVQANLAGDYDVFISEFDTTQAGAASLLFSTFFGGTLYDEAQGMAIDAAGNVYVTGYTGSANFPVLNAAQAVSSGGNDAFAAKLGNAAALALNAVAVNPAVVTGGATSTGTVTLSGAAPAGGAVVTLSSNSAAAGVPVNVTVPAGGTSTTFNITTTGVTTTASATISAVYGAVTKTAMLTVNPPAAALAAVGVNPASMTGGGTSIGTVTLALAAPAGGAVVTLSSNKAAAAVPANVTVAAGATKATFNINTTAVTTVVSVTLSANYDGITKTTVLTVNPPAAALSAITVNPATVTGGTASAGTITLTAAAPVGGAIVALSSNNAAASVPTSVTVTAGATSANFNIATTGVTMPAAATLSSVYNGVTKTAVLTVNPPAAAAVASVTMSPVSVTGGIASTGTVTLSGAAPSGGTVVTLASNNTAAVTVPLSITVAAGAASATFKATSRAVIADTAVTISATSSNTKTAVLTVLKPVLSSATASQSSLGNNSAVTGTVNLTGAVKANAVITLTSSAPAVASVPATVTVLAGARTATFPITAGSVTASTNVTLSATFEGVTKTKAISVKPVAMYTVTLNPAAVTGGTPSTGTAKINAAAAAGGVTVALASSGAGVLVPAMVTIPAGTISVTFPLTTQAVVASTPVTISGTYKGVTKSAILTVNP